MWAGASDIQVQETATLDIPSLTVEQIADFGLSGAV